MCPACGMTDGGAPPAGALFATPRKYKAPGLTRTLSGGGTPSSRAAAAAARAAAGASRPMVEGEVRVLIASSSTLAPGGPCIGAEERAGPSPSEAVAVVTAVDPLAAAAGPSAVAASVTVKTRGAQTSSFQDGVLVRVGGKGGGGNLSFFRAGGRARVFFSLFQ